MVTAAKSVKHVSTRVLVGAALIAAAVPMLVVMACGPDFQPEVFVPPVHPESATEFATGKLGVLQPGYARADKVVAYRYLVGGKLNDAEKAAYTGAPSTLYDASNWQAQHDAEQAVLPVNQWRVARAAALKVDVKQTPEIAQDKTLEVKRNGYVERNDLLNCPDDAFLTAKASLGARVKQWGAGSADLADWLRGQDAVFSNCAKPGEIPQAAPASASSLLTMDREYQVAAAKFYAGDYDSAIAGFEAVAKDISSPWQPWGEYLAARAEVRKAMITAAPGEGDQQATFDPALLKKARTRLEKVAAVSGDRMRHAAQAELNFIEVRLDPQKRLNDSAVALAGPAPDAEFAQHLADMRFLTDHGETGDADLLRWMGYGDDDNKARRIGLGKGDLDAAEWKKRQTELWLVAALTSAKAKDAGVAGLLGAAAKIPAGSPAYVTVSYQRARLMLESGDHTAARKLTTTVLAGLNGEGTDATRNALLGLRIQTANAYAEFLADAPRTVIPSNTMSQAANVAICEDSATPPGCVKKIPPLQFDSDVAQAFNRQLPLARWVEAAKAKEIPEHLRGAIAMAAWLRAQGLGDEATVKVTAAMLPAPVHTAAGDGTGFPVILALLRNPGIRPYLEQGVQRSVSYKVQDEFRDNWWCAKWSGPPDQVYDTVVTVVPPLPLGFLSDAEKHVETEEKKKLDALPFGVVWLGQRAIEFVKTRPDDKDAAEALALTVRATRFGCYIGDDKAATALDQKAVSKEAFNILHKQYPKSPWTAKTPYYY